MIVSFFLNLQQHSWFTMLPDTFTQRKNIDRSRSSILFNFIRLYRKVYICFCKLNEHVKSFESAYSYGDASCDATIYSFTKKWAVECRYPQVAVSNVTPCLSGLLQCGSMRKQHQQFLYRNTIFVAKDSYQSACVSDFIHIKQFKLTYL